jgi:hypothetical protein
MRLKPRLGAQHELLASRSPRARICALITFLAAYSAHTLTAICAWIARCSAILAALRSSLVSTLVVTTMLNRLLVVKKPQRFQLGF